MFHGLFSNGLEGTAGYRNDDTSGDGLILEEQQQLHNGERQRPNTHIHSYDRGDISERKAISALNSCLKVAEDTNQIAQRTAQTVAMQGDQIKNIDAEAKKIEHNLDVSDHLLDSMGSWTSSISSMFSGMWKGKNVEHSKLDRSKSTNIVQDNKCDEESNEDNGNDWNKNWENKYNKSQLSQVPEQAPKTERSGNIWKVLGSSTGGFETDFNNGLMSLSRILSETGEQAVLMNAELKDQTGTLRQVHKSSDQSKIRISEQQLKMQRIMGKR